MERFKAKVRGDTASSHKGEKCSSCGEDIVCEPENSLVEGWVSSTLAWGGSTFQKSRLVRGT